MWTKNSEVEKQSISVGSGTEQVSLRGCFSLGAALLSTVKSAILSSPTAITIPALTLPSSNLVQMERSRRSNSLFCCGFLSRFGFFSMRPSRIRLLIQMPQLRSKNFGIWLGPSRGLNMPATRDVPEFRPDFKKVPDTAGIIIGSGRNKVLLKTALFPNCFMN